MSMCEDVRAIFWAARNDRLMTAQMSGLRITNNNDNNNNDNNNNDNNENDNNNNIVAHRRPRQICK